MDVICLYVLGIIIHVLTVINNDILLTINYDSVLGLIIIWINGSQTIPFLRDGHPTFVSVICGP